MSFWDVIVLLFCIYLLVAYAMFMVQIVGDLLVGARGLSGWWKAVWFLALLILPLVTAFVYLVARSRGMGEVESTSLHRPDPAEQLAEARALLNAGTITKPEFDRLKARALA